MKPTDAMVEAACKGYWPSHWPQQFAGGDLTSIRGHMLAAITAALSHPDAQAVSREEVIRECAAIAGARDEDGYLEWPDGEEIAKAILALLTRKAQ